MPPTYRAGPYEIQVIRHESVGAPAALVTIYRCKAFVEMAVVPVEGVLIGWRSEPPDWDLQERVRFWQPPSRNPLWGIWI